MKMPFSAIERVLDLVKMPDLHNSFGEPALSHVQAQLAINLLVDLPDDVPDPRMYPKGGFLILEFHDAVIRIGETVTVLDWSGNILGGGVGDAWNTILGKERASQMVMDAVRKAAS